MLIKDLVKHKRTGFSKTIDDFSPLKITNVLIQNYQDISYEFEATYLEPTDEIEVLGTINFSLIAIDARDGKPFTHQDEIQWDTTYLLSDFTNGEVDFDQLVSEQINVNIPINLTHNHGTINKVGPGWQLLTEDEFEKNQLQTSDPRWDKLKEIK